jgi:hypothetical protein
MLGRLRLLLVVLVGALLLGACRVDTTVRVQVDERGAGSVAVRVVLDADAVAQLGTNPWQQLKVDDLRAAGWTVEGPTETGGKTVLTATKAFADATQLPLVLAEVFGPNGLMRDPRLERARSFGETRWTFTATIDPSQGPQSLSDAQVTALLGGQPLGRSVASLEQQSGVSLAAAAGLTIAVQMPGEVSSNAITADGGAPAWRATFANTPVEVFASGTMTDAAARRWVYVAGVAVALLVLLLFWRLVRRGTRGGGGDAEEPFGEVAPPAPPIVSAAAQPATARRARAVEMVVLHDSVLFEPGASLHDVLVPFVVARGGSPDVARIGPQRAALDAGRIDTGSFWYALGVAGDADELDRSLVERLMMSGDLAPLAARLASRGLRLAVFADGPTRWFELIRERFSLDAAVGSWIVSSEVGAHTPDMAAFAAIEFLVQLPFARCLYVDDDPVRLDSAATLGMRAVRLRRDDSVSGPDVDTRTITRLLDLVRA